MISTLKNNNITDLSNLVFFTEKGYEVPILKTFSILWEIIPHDQVAANFISNPYGHFMFDITDPDKTLYTVIDSPGKIIDSEVTIRGNLDEETKTRFETTLKTVLELVLLNIKYSYKKSKGHFKNRNTGLYEYIYEDVNASIHNEVKITFNTLTDSITKIFPIEYIFDTITLDNTNDTISLNSNLEDNIKYAIVKTLGITVLEGSDQYKTLVNLLIGDNYSYESLFPCVNYMGTIKQDKVSTEFIAASTFIILEKDGNKYERPSFDSENNYKLRFEFQKGTECKFISSDSIANIIWNDSYEVDSDETNIAFTEGLNKKDGTTPIYFTIGFETEIEGCYQNIMAMYIVNKNTNEKHLMGLFTFLTEVEGEDERYRALLGNFGIPDPVKYPNIFKSLDPMEQGVDWTLINTKSKELMISYDNIFPYVGTYKALLGAVRFLGYEDLIFKEWYKIKDLNNRDKYITLLTYDLQKGEALLSKLKKIGVSFGEFERYKKLNRLTMIYHLNEIDDETGEYIDVWTQRTDISNLTTTSPENGLYKAVNPSDDTHYAEYDLSGEFKLKQQLFFQLPFTKRIYEYRTDEILAKLFSVKQWLEKYILGVNCYISDICGEGIIIERFKNQAYVTLHHIKDITTIGNFTPKIFDKTTFIDSSAFLTCSLNEFDSLTIDDYKDFSIDSFIKETYTDRGETIYISAPLETLVVANEYQFQLTNIEPTSGSLAEFTDSSYINNPMLILDNEILFFDDTLNITKIDRDELPIIEINLGNLRFCHGNWKSNIAFSINITVDQKTGKEYYTMYDLETGDIFYKGFQKVILYPYVKNGKVNTYKLYWVLTDGDESSRYSNSYNGLPSEMIYTSHNKWNVPMLIIRNFKCGNNNELIPGDYILEIIKGKLLFKNKHDDLNTGKAYGCEVEFGLEFENKEQPINVRYTYLSDRLPIYSFDKKKLKGMNITEDNITSCVSTNRYVDVQVNRLGNYIVTVNAYDSYNNIFVNKSDDITNLNIKPIEIDTIINSNYVKNDPDFFERNSTGTLLTNNEKYLLFKDIEQYASYPIYPQTYRIYDIDPVIDSSNLIEYDNISYAIDTPKSGDFLIFNNFTERVLNITKEGDNIYKLKLLDESPNFETIQCSSTVGLCVYDSIQKDIIADIYPLKVNNIQINNASYGYYDVNNSWMTVEKFKDTLGDDVSKGEHSLDDLADRCTLNTSLLNSSDYFMNSINVYVYTANEYVISSSDNIIIDKDNNETHILLSALKQLFVETQVIKICYTTETEIHNRYTKNAIDNETAYRIKRIEDNNGKFDYILNGIIDLLKLNNGLYHNSAKLQLNPKDGGKLFTVVPYKLKICPVHLRAALYMLRVDGFGEEMVYNYNNGNVMRTQVQYEPTPLLFDSYLDTTYSAQIFDYDPKLLQNIWSDAFVKFKKTDKLYRYRDLPISISKGRTLLMQPNKDLVTLTNKFENKLTPMRVHWDWKSYFIDDHSNWHSELNQIGKHVIFKSANKVLSIMPELLGTQSPNMICTDIYGNRLINEGDGFIYVDENGMTVTRMETDTRDVYYKDVFIVGFESNFLSPSVLSMSGETVTYGIVETGSSLSGVKPIEFTYKIYYSDGTVLENIGATVNLLTNTEKISKTNKVKFKIGHATQLHKTTVGEIKGIFKFNKTHDRDLIKGDQFFSVDIKQYGTSITDNISNFTFNMKPIPKEGIEKLLEYIIRDYIYDIKYTVRRTGGEVENVHYNNIELSYLKIIDYTFLHDQYGNTDNISKNNNGYRHIGIIQITVQFVVNGIVDVIKTTGFTNVYQE